MAKLAISLKYFNTQSSIIGRKVKKCLYGKKLCKHEAKNEFEV